MRTQGKWEAHYNIGKKGEIGVVAYNAPCIIAVMGNQKEWPAEAYYNAEFICKAVNNYDRLLGSLKSATAWLERLECVGNELEQFQAAIAEAEGK